MSGERREKAPIGDPVVGRRSELGEIGNGAISRSQAYLVLWYQVKGGRVGGAKFTGSGLLARR